ncbi:hypothetical protein GYMLUDRAFT_237720 [Collybiopsis luxurians FD-317 M1]|nr:hypothetical protein GYMLUDRAFT_237720 [Collybiopsis luxurians FD-317 M1]
MALYGGSKRMKVFLSVAGLCVFINSLVQLYLAGRQTVSDIQTQSPLVLKQIGNVPVFTASQGNYFICLWMGVSAFDLCVFCLTLRKTLGLIGTSGGGIVSVVMRDG